MEDLVSIIIPVYNIDKYIEQCIVSIQNQDYSNLEIIIIDNGSTDNSASIINSLSKNDKRIVVLFVDNIGASSARNLGILKAKGEYVCFIDGDDWIEPNYVSFQKHLIDCAKADFCVCNYFTQGRETGQWNDAILEGKLEIITEYFNNHMFNRVYNKMFKMEFLNGITFPEGKDFYEDGVFTAKVLSKAAKVVRTAAPLYHYRVRQDGLMRRKRTVGEKSIYYNNVFNRLYILGKVIKDKKHIERLYSEIKNSIYGFVDSAIDISLLDNFVMIQKMMIENHKNIQNILADNKKNIFDVVISSNAKSFIKDIYKFRIQETSGMRKKVSIFLSFSMNKIKRFINNVRVRSK